MIKKRIKHIILGQLTLAFSMRLFSMRLFSMRLFNNKQAPVCPMFIQSDHGTHPHQAG